LADHLVSEHKALTVLDDVTDFLDWQAIEDLLCDIHAKRRGNSAWPPLFMFTASFGASTQTKTSTVITLKTPKWVGTCLSKHAFDPRTKEEKPTQLRLRAKPD
jgi:hypothetical protein